MICSRRLYKGNSYEICLPLTDTGVTLVRFYTRGDVIIEKEPEITGDSMCFSFTEEEIASLPDGVLRYELVTEYETTDTNSPYVIVTPADYSGSTLDDLLEDAFDSGYTAGQEDCSGETIHNQSKAFQINGNNAGFWRYSQVYSFMSGGTLSGNVTIKPDSGYTGLEDVQIFMWLPADEAVELGYQQGVAEQKGKLSSTAITQNGTFRNSDSGWSSVTVNVHQTGHTDQEMQDSWDSGYTSGKTDGYESGYTAGQEDCSGSSCNLQDRQIVNFTELAWNYTPKGTWQSPMYTLSGGTLYVSADTGYDGLETVLVGGKVYADEAYNDGFGRGYTSGYTDGVASVDCTDYFNSGYTSGYTDGNADLIANLQGDYFVIPEGTTRLRDFALYSLCVSAITIPDSVTSIGENVFAYNNCLSSITLPDSVTGIGQMALFHCENLLDVHIGSGITVIPQELFGSCYSLTSLTFPAGVTIILNNALAGDFNLTGITFEGTVPPTIHTGNSLGSTAYTYPIYVPCESVEAYKTAFGAKYAPRVTCIQPEPDYSGMPLTMEITSPGYILYKDGSQNGYFSGATISYSMDSGVTWTTISGLTGGTQIQVSSGDTVMFKGDNATYGTNGLGFLGFSNSTAGFKVYGNIMSLIDSQGFISATTLSSQWTFAHLFADCTGLTDASNLVLPATSLSLGCYEQLFLQCTNLVSAPELPAIVLSPYCYELMFGYTNLIDAPVLCATTLTDHCYFAMFRFCGSLQKVVCYATDISANACTVDWLESVPAEGTFEKAPGMTSWPSGSAGIPTGWTVVDAQ